MTPLDFNTLSDAQINVAVAEIDETPEKEFFNASTGGWAGAEKVVQPYATSCDECARLLEGFKDVRIDRVEENGWQVSIMHVERKPGETVEGVTADAWEDTFPRAACLAWGRAKGVFA